ncbi:MAG: hypothetical protein BGP09_23350 [Rhizobium sp. 60-20]|jgi:hypothetical protein|nr:MAG: hypothetical protein BGP09_23350 [Rhizobium sp. 60-20]
MTDWLTEPSASLLQESRMGDVHEVEQSAPDMTNARIALVSHIVGLDQSSQNGPNLHPSDRPKVGG